MNHIIVFLLFLSPLLGEVLSGSTPPLEFINPIGLVFLTLLYGCGTLLIREAKARWGLQWSIVFLAVAYGILEEGVMIQSFFNVSHADLGTLSDYGMYFGVQWPWAIMLILFHGTMSTIIPIEVADLLWPEHKNSPLLSKRGVIFSSAGLILVTVFWMIFAVGQKSDSAYADYRPNNLLITGSILIVLLLIGLAHKYRDSRISENKFRLLPPFAFGIAGFIFQATNIFLPNALAEFKTPGIITILVQVILAAMTLLFIGYQVYHRNETRQHTVSLVFGSILFWIFLTPVHEFSNGISGILLFGMISLALLILWRRTALHNPSLP